MPACRYLLLVILLGSVLSGCNIDPPYVDSYTIKKPSIKDLSGTYVLADETLDHGRAIIDSDPYQPGSVLKAKNGSKSAIQKMILRPDGTFSAINVPLWSGNSAQGWEIKNFQSGSGKWKPIYAGGRYLLAFYAPKLKLIPNDYYSYIALLGQNQPYTILFFYGLEPDDDSAMLFEQRN